MKEIVGKNGLQILTFWRSLQTGKMCSSSRNGDRQTANAGNVGSRDPLPFAGKKYAVLKDGAYYCYCAYVLRILRYSDFLSVVLTNTGLFLRDLKLSGESRS